MFNKDIDIQDGIVSSRIRLARNLKRFPFHLKMNHQQKEELNNLVESTLNKVDMGDNPFVYIRLAQIKEINAYALLEQHLISADLVKEKQHSMIALSKDRRICIMVNEEDHIRIQVLQDNFDLDNALDTANKIDEILDKDLDYAFDENLGFLTSCPTNLGTGLRASVLLHLPALEKAGIMPKLIGTIGKLGLTIRGSYGEGSEAIGSMYTVSNQITLGIAEEQAVSNLQSVVREIIAQEKSAREKIMANNDKFEDTVYRSLGILQNARILSSKEYYTLISNIRMGIGQGIITSIDLSDINALDKKTGSAVICESHGVDLPPQQRDSIRAKIVREALKP